MLAFTPICFQIVLTTDLGLSIKMFVIDDQKATTIDKIVGRNVSKFTTIIIDGSASHVNFEHDFQGHETHIEEHAD